MGNCQQWNKTPAASITVCQPLHLQFTKMAVPTVNGHFCLGDKEGESWLPSTSKLQASVAWLLFLLNEMPSPPYLCSSGWAAY